MTTAVRAHLRDRSHVALTLAAKLALGIAGVPLAPHVVLDIATEIIVEFTSRAS